MFFFVLIITIEKIGKCWKNSSKKKKKYYILNDLDHALVYLVQLKKGAFIFFNINMPRMQGSYKIRTPIVRFAWDWTTKRRTQ